MKFLLKMLQGMGEDRFVYFGQVAHADFSLSPENEFRNIIPVSF